VRHFSRANCAETNFLGSKKPAHEGIKERYPVKVVILPLLASLSWKQLEIDWQFVNKNCY